MQRWALPTLVLLSLLAETSALAAQAVRPPEVRYYLHAGLDDETGKVTGTSRIHYTHYNPDSTRALTLALGHNAFRPGAQAWPARQPASADDIGFQHIASVTVDGSPVTIEWPRAPDSTLARIVLPRAFAPAESLTLSLQWETRPPALPWRTQRRARRVNLVGWYPLLLDETARTSVLSPAIASHTLELDVASDQVIGGTGIVLCGNPGWAGATASHRSGTTESPESSEHCGPGAPGRKKIKWHAQAVTELVFGVSPTFRYEEGNIFEKPVRVFYEQGQETTWGAGLATRRAETALAWTAEIIGSYPWPHVAVIASVDNSRQGLPMVLLTDNPSQSTLINLAGLMISQQMLVGGAPVFTIGSAAFQTTWFFETLGRRGDYARLEREILDWDLDGLARTDEPLPASRLGSPCTTAFCLRTEFLQHQLRWWAGDDQLFRRLYRAIIDRFLLKPTFSGGFAVVSREVVKPDPTPLFGQLATGKALYDDAIGSMQREQLADGRWQTTVVVERRAAGRFPQTVWVIAEHDTTAARATALTDRETLTITTPSRPLRVVIDPLAESHDWNMLNNQRAFSRRLLAGSRPKSKYLDTYFARHAARDRLMEGYAPTIWYNDAGGWTYGLRVRQNYLGRFELNEGWVSLSRGAHKDVDLLLRLRNPVWLRATGWSQALELAHVEGRAGAKVDVAYQFPHAITDHKVRELGLVLQWLTVTDADYLTARSHDDVSTAELTGRARIASAQAAWPFSLQLALGAGLADSDGYARFTSAGALRAPIAHDLAVGLRMFAGAVSHGAPRQRRIYIAGADPYERFGNPFLRSRGALLARPDFFYHAPGGAGLRLGDPELSGEKAVGTSIELEYTVLSGGGSLLGRGAIAGFGDVVASNGDFDPASSRMVRVAAAGIGVRFDHRIGATSFQSRIDLPLWRSRSDLRGWAVSLAPAF